MIKITGAKGQRGTGNIEFRAEKPKQTVPKVSLKEIDGVMMYEGTGEDNKGKLYVPELYDRMFQVVPVQIIKRVTGRVIVNQRPGR